MSTDIGMPVPTSPAGVRVERLVTSGVFELDGGSWEVDNNVWLLGDDRQVLVVDAAHDAGAIVDAVAGREVVALVCTHGHNDHVNAVSEVVAATGATAYLHPDDRVLWDMSQDAAPGAELADGQFFTVGDVEATVLHTPGHAPGACCLSVPALGVLFSGDTLFQGGPGATGRSYSDFPTIVESIRTRLLELPADTVVLTGHGDPTTIGAEAPHLQEWLDRGH
ncbi:glyoxylase-like metal-dependent hydrolase (beta-lactamase superfamily II) [Phycicoccus duodecadis]|uniref:Glyoxylase-like metal-dependent hydrolase (Beta-lactamase superfamily II) n=2 Tax=Phycicoccus duodecadis TaxID=173053 RepID=A0A2N3YIG8_9MICO|nr:glyoxylase-like metal-dependent hydrolase (beta-lactamase superfamily II) [Phycicoccus duodecadis]